MFNDLTDYHETILLCTELFDYTDEQQLAQQIFDELQNKGVCYE